MQAGHQPGHVFPGLAPSIDMSRSSSWTFPATAASSQTQTRSSQDVLQPGNLGVVTTGALLPRGTEQTERD